MGYGNDDANAENVPFSYALALEAARDLYALAGHVRARGADRQAHAHAATADWAGPRREMFDQMVLQERHDTAAIAEGLVATADGIARSWARARGRQDRLNQARWVRHELDRDGWLANPREWTWFGKQDDYGPPPEDPPVPRAPRYEPTRAPMYPEFEVRP
jgi:hypothetical protein